MPDDYPNNSHSARAGSMTEPPREKRLEKVVTGNAKTKKKSGAKKFLGIFVADDMDNIRSSILSDALIPGLKRILAEAFSIFLFGDADRIGGKGRSKSTISYQRYWDEKRDDRRDYTRPRTSGFDYDDIEFESRGDADMVLEQLEAVIDQYGMVSVADLFDLAGVTCKAGFPANKYGWTDLRDAHIIRTRDGYILSLPRTVQIT